MYSLCFVQKFCIEVLLYADQHFTCDRDTSKGVKVRHCSLRIRYKVLILDSPVSVCGKLGAVMKITWTLNVLTFSRPFKNFPVYPWQYPIILPDSQRKDWGRRNLDWAWNLGSRTRWTIFYVIEKLIKWKTGYYVKFKYSHLHGWELV